MKKLKRMIAVLCSCILCSSSVAAAVPAWTNVNGVFYNDKGEVIKGAVAKGIRQILNLPLSDAVTGMMTYPKTINILRRIFKGAGITVFHMAYIFTLMPQIQKWRKARQLMCCG